MQYACFIQKLSYHFHYLQQVLWKERAYHTSSTIAMDSTHIRVIVFGGYSDCPDTKKPEKYPMLSDTFVFDISKYSLLLLH